MQTDTFGLIRMEENNVKTGSDAPIGADIKIGSSAWGEPETEEENEEETR